MKKYWTTEGNVRGCCGHHHRSVETAIDCLARDHRGCESVGGYSDRRVIEVDEDGNRQIVPVCLYD